jgi:hypothetical protein
MPPDPTDDQCSSSSLCPYINLVVKMTEGSATVVKAIYQAVIKSLREVSENQFCGHEHDDN